MDALMLGFALVFGAPLSVPISLALAPRRLWLALPAISLAAAVGIALQIPAIFTGGQASSVLVIDWILPATLGAGAAALLRFYDRLALHVAVALVATAMLAAIAYHDRPAPNDPKYDASARLWSERVSSSWRYVRVGSLVFAGTDQRHPYAASQIMCSSREAFIQWWEGKTVSECFPVAHGAPAKVISLLPSNCIDRVITCTGILAGVRGSDWRGVSPLSYFQPNISPGTTLHMECSNSSPCLLHIAPTWRLTHIDLGDDVYVILKRYDLRSADNTLFVNALSGKYRGRSGWMAVQDVAPMVGQGLYGIVDRQ